MKEINVPICPLIDIYYYGAQDRYDKFTIKITNIVGIINFLDYLYEDSNFYLKRKKEYYEKYRKYRTTVESNYKRELRGSYVKTS